MAIEVFNRQENKYLIDSRIYYALQNRLSDYMDLDDYNKQHETYSICNIYYDTDDSYLIRTSIKKPSYKEKLRIRSYGTPNANSNVYVEIKKKVCGLVNKRRSALVLNDAYRFLETAELPVPCPGQNGQVLKEIRYILEQRKLRPELYLAYKRRAYFNEGNHDLRISFDTAITTRRYDLNLESGIYGERLLTDGLWIMEIKTAESIPFWLARMLSEYKIYPTSFSKYGTEYKTRIIQESLGKSPAFTPEPVPASAFSVTEGEMRYAV